MLRNVLELNKGQLEVDNLRIKGFEPFQVCYEDIGFDAIQVDVTGVGLVNYYGKLSPELEMEINTNVLKALKKYSEVTEHDSSEIGYSISFKPTNKLNKKFDLYESGFQLMIMFKKPVEGASAYSLQPTIELITATILAEVFMSNE